MLLLLVACCAAWLSGQAVAAPPAGTESVRLVVQNTGTAAVDVATDEFTGLGMLNGDSRQVARGIASYASTFVDLKKSGPGTHGLSRSGQPLASVLVREITAAGGSSNHSLSIASPAVTGSPAVALPILLSNFSSEQWQSRLFVRNVGTRSACVRITYFVSATLGSAQVGQKIVDSPTGKLGCAAGYLIEPDGQLDIGEGATNPFPQPLNATQSAALVEVLNPSSRNGISATAELYRTDGNRLIGAYDGFAVRATGEGKDDAGTEVIIPLAIKHSSGYYSVVGVQNLGTAASNINIRYIGATEQGEPVDTTVVLPAVANVGFHSTFDESTPIPVDFVGYAVVTSAQPVAAVVIRGKQTSYLSGINEPIYTAVNGVPGDRAETVWYSPLVYRRYKPIGANYIGWNSWIQVQVADGGAASVTLRFTGTPGFGCPTGTYTRTFNISGSGLFYMAADSGNGFPDPAPSCFVGSARVESTRPVIVITNVSSDSFPDGDNEALYNAIPATGRMPALAPATDCAAEDAYFVSLVAADDRLVDEMNAFISAYNTWKGNPTSSNKSQALTKNLAAMDAVIEAHTPLAPAGEWSTWDYEYDRLLATIQFGLSEIRGAIEDDDIPLATFIVVILINPAGEAYSNQFADIPDFCQG